MTEVTKSDADRVFNETFNGEPNFMTPNIIRRGKQGNYFYELSRGTFMEDTLFGVTVLTLEGERTDLSDCFQSRDQAEAHIKRLRDED